MIAQLPLPIVLDCDPRVQQAAARELQRITEAKRNSFECEQFRRRRAAMLRHTRQMGT
jgi:hypothetical protein